jgi:hypothetical protein
MDAFRNPEFWDAAQGARSTEHETVHEVRRGFEHRVTQRCAQKMEFMEAAV